ncbi:IclR family transcriptional regulator [Chitinasiproducens palmae]|nr:IclR family transcriptional regulator [Chitinasiproducens palmae]
MTNKETSGHALGEETRDSAAVVSRGAETGALTRGLQLLAVMSDASRPLSLSEIAEASGIAASTTHRLLHTLSQCEQVYKNAQGRYCLAPRALFPLGLDHPLQVLRRDAAEMLRELQARHGPSVLLVAFLGEKRMVVDFAPGAYSVAPYFDTRISAPAHASVSGKILLADLPEADRQRLLGDAPYPARTRHTITTRAALDDALAEVEASGLATNFNENVMGICAIGAPLVAPSGRAIGAIVLTGPDTFFGAERRDAIAEDVRRVAHMLSAMSMSVRAVARFLSL